MPELELPVGGGSAAERSPLAVRAIS
jgi:hypothetical protein